MTDEKKLVEAAQQMFAASVARYADSAQAAGRAGVIAAIDGAEIYAQRHVFGKYVPSREKIDETLMAQGKEFLGRKQARVWANTAKAVFDHMLENEFDFASSYENDETRAYIEEYVLELTGKADIRRVTTAGILSAMGLDRRTGKPKTENAAEPEPEAEAGAGDTSPTSEPLSLLEVNSKLAKLRDSSDPEAYKAAILAEAQRLMGDEADVTGQVNEALSAAVGH